MSRSTRLHRQVSHATVTAAALLAFTSLPAAASEWQHEVTPYLWASGMDGAVTIGQPQGRDIGVDRLARLFSFARRQPVAGHLLEQARQTLDFRGHCSAAGFCRMSGQHELNEKLIQKGLQLFPRYPFIFQGKDAIPY